MERYTIGSAADAAIAQRRAVVAAPSSCRIERALGLSLRWLSESCGSTGRPADAPRGRRSAQSCSAGSGTKGCLRSP